MHPYATDSEERRSVLMAIFLVSIGLAYGLHWLMAQVGTQPPWWMGSPSVLGIAGIFYTVFDNWLWRLFINLNVVKIPDLQGQWEVKGYTSFEQTESFKAKATIRQTWTHMSIRLETQQSVSWSLAASLSVKQPEGIVLIYHYRNSPKPERAAETMHAHIGTAILRLESADCMEGEYYTGRDRQNYGRLTFRRTPLACR